MKKIYVLLFIASAMTLQFCATKKKMIAAAPVVTKISYIANVQAIMVNNCSPCHFPPQGNKKPLNTYLAVKEDIDEVIARVQRNPADRGFMPQRHPKLSDSTINVLVKWKTDGLAEN